MRVGNSFPEDSRPSVHSHANQMRTSDARRAKNTGTGSEAPRPSCILAAILHFSALPVVGQTTDGELHLRAIDPPVSEQRRPFTSPARPISSAGRHSSHHNRCPSFGLEIEADDTQFINIYTAGIPAACGGKLLPRRTPGRSFFLRLSYDGVFQIPCFENLLLAGSTAVGSIERENFLRLPVQPSVGSYYDVGATSSFLDKIRLATNYFPRRPAQFAGDVPIRNTTISFPIAFHNAILSGAGGKLELSDWRRFSGFLSYSS